MKCAVTAGRNVVSRMALFVFFVASHSWLGIQAQAATINIKNNSFFRVQVDFQVKGAPTKARKAVLAPGAQRRFEIDSEDEARIKFNQGLVDLSSSQRNDINKEIAAELATSSASITAIAAGSYLPACGLLGPVLAAGVPWAVFVAGAAVVGGRYLYSSFSRHSCQVQGEMLGDDEEMQITLSNVNKRTFSYTMTVGKPDQQQPEDGRSQEQ